MPNKTLRGYPLVRMAVDLISKQIRFDPEDCCPLCCYEKCSHYDGKRCSLTGNEPEQLCRPACAKLLKALMVLDEAMFAGCKS